MFTHVNEVLEPSMLVIVKCYILERQRRIKEVGIQLIQAGSY